MKSPRETQKGDPVAADLFVLETMRWARQEFEKRLCAMSVDRSDPVLEVLRLETTYQFAEFFYLLRAQRIETAEQLAQLEEGHSRYFDQLSRDKAKIKRLKLRESRVSDALFTGDTRPRLIQDWRDNPGTIDQSNLARFLAMTMSKETCRSLAVACASAGFLTRWKSPLGTTLVRSTGIMEDVFGEYLRAFRNRIVEGA